MCVKGIDSSIKKAKAKQSKMSLDFFTLHVVKMEPK